MKKSDMVRILDKRCRHLQRQQEHINSGCNVEAAHNFRLEVKKLRAVLRLFRHPRSHAADLQLPGSLQQVYQAVGRVRNFQLQRAWVQNVCAEMACPVPAGYLEVLGRHEKETRKQVKEKAKEVSVPHIRLQLIKALPADLHKKDVQNFVQQKKLQLAAYLAATVLTENVLHDIRKLLKDLLYVWPWIDGVMSEAFPPQFFTKEACLRLAERLGNFQDCCVALTLFSATFFAGLSPEERKRLTLLKEKCRLKKEKEKEAIIVTLLLLKNELQAKMKVQLPAPSSTG